MTTYNKRKGWFIVTTFLIDRVSQFYDVSYVAANDIISDYTKRGQLNELLKTVSLEDEENKIEEVQ